jgi:hypothetical protein
MVRPERFELPACCSGGNRSIQLSYGRMFPYSLHGEGKLLNHNLGRTHRGIRQRNTSNGSRHTLRAKDHAGSHLLKMIARADAEVSPRTTRDQS